MPAKKSLGQHWLTDQAVLQTIVNAIEPTPKDTIVEIGPGHGSLTSLLAKQAGKVIAVELDVRLASSLAKMMPDKNVDVINQDILTLDWSTLPAGYKVVGNIPYYLSSKLIRTLLEATNQPAVIALLVQKEVARRVAAGSGSMSLLSVSAQYYADVKLKQEVPAELFSPKPKVDSQIVQLTPRAIPLFEADPKKLFRVVAAGFSNRRKIIKTSLAGGLQLDKANTEKILKQSGIDPNKRAQELTMKEWEKLYNKLYN